jgi:hypothetical protein
MVVGHPLGVFVLGASFFTAAPAVAASEPPWVTTGGSSAQYPRAEFLTGFAVDHGGDLGRAKDAARADLGRTITVRVRQSAHAVDIERDGIVRYEAASMTAASSDVRVHDVGFETHQSQGRAYALAILDRAKYAVALRGERDRLVAVTEACLEASETVNGEAVPLRMLAGCRAHVAEATEAEAALRAVSTPVPADGPIAARLVDLQQAVEERARGLLRRPVSTLKDAVEILGDALGQQGIKGARSVVVEPLTVGTTPWSSTFGRHFAGELERALAAAVAGPAPVESVVVRGTHIEIGRELRVLITARDAASGRLLAGADVTLPKSVVPGSLALRPRNHVEALRDDRVLAGGELVTSDLRLELVMDKGWRAPVYRSGEVARVFFRVNQPAYVRLIYLLAGGQKVLLEDGYYVDASKVNFLVEYPASFDVVAPWGTETLFAVASTAPLPPIKTSRTVVDGEEYQTIADTTAAVRYRGLIRRAPDAPRFAEAIVTLTTMPER